MVAERLQSDVVLDQLEMMRLRNTARAFTGSLQIADTPSNQLAMTWSLEDDSITLQADLDSHEFTISHSPAGSKAQLYTYPKPRYGQCLSRA